MRAAAIWASVIAIALMPIVVATQSPLLAWRDTIYIIGGFAGIIGMAILLLQPLLADGVLPGLTTLQSRRVHRWLGGGLLAAVIVHVSGLWITSPPDVVDVLLFRSPTPFGLWGAIAMWGVFLAAGLAVMRRRLRPQVWRNLHLSLAVVIVVATLLHAVLIEGAMGQWSKTALAVCIVFATGFVLWRRVKPAARRVQR